MARIPRSITVSNYYHVMIRGIGHMNLFYDDGDRIHFLRIVSRYSKEVKINIFAYCLMDNHVHFLLKADVNEMSLFFKKLEVSYAYYFNGRYEHVGHLFQNRFQSQPIDQERYFIVALKYILLNPENAGICSWRDYRWSSARAYLYDNIRNPLTDTKYAINCMGGRNELVDFITDEDVEDEFCILNGWVEPQMPRKLLPDAELVEIIKKTCKVMSPIDLQNMERSERDRCLSALKRQGASVRQLERVTGINRGVIGRAM